MSPNKPVTLITGGGTGIGAAVARRLSTRGENVVVCGRREGPLNQVADDTGALAVVADVATVRGATKAVDATAERFGQLDGLVLNAGIMRAGTVDAISAQEWRESLEANLSSAFFVVRRAIDMLRASRGSIVCVASIAALRSGPAMIAYSTAKAGLVALSQGLALDHAADGIRVNCVCPGWTRTPMADAEMVDLGGLEASESLDAAYEFATRLVPQRRAADADEIAAVICWLLSGEASYVTGATLVADGGSVLVDAGSIPGGST